jgi:phospholipase C
VRAVRTAIARIVGFFRSLFAGGQETPAGWVEIDVDESVAALDQIEHVVVLMLENRSFDHMLGYLGLEAGGPKVDGLQPGMANEHAGRSYPVFRLDRTAFKKPQDPCHSGACVDEQVANGNSGFAANYMKTREDPGAAEPVVVMGHYDGEQLPIYDFLTRHFVVCDRWFCSLKGATFPNRLYAVAGAARPEAGTTPARPSTTSRRSSATSTPPGQAGAGTRTRSSRPSGRSTATTCRTRSTTCGPSRQA